MRYLCLLAMLAVCAGAQSQQDQAPRQHDDYPQAQTETQPNRKHGRSAGKEVGSGAGDIGKGAAKGAGNVAKGTGKGALDLVTLHPIDAASAAGKGAVVGGKDVTVGTVKGTGKIGKGIGKAIKKIF